MKGLNTGDASHFVSSLTLHLMYHVSDADLSKAASDSVLALACFYQACSSIIANAQLAGNSLFDVRARLGSFVQSQYPHFIRSQENTPLASIHVQSHRQSVSEA
jgi:hypothetical protein